jgi:hypothetical protein
MYEASARNLRTVERFLLVPALPANFGSVDVAVSDISERGARVVHQKPFETGKKGALKIPLEGRPKPLTLEAVVVWTHSDPTAPARFISGVRTYGAPDVINSLMAQLQTSRRSNRIEELRSADRFFVAPPVDAVFGETRIRIENIAARGARFESSDELPVGTSALLRFSVPDGTVEAEIKSEVRWSAMKAITGTNRKTYRIGVQLTEKPVLMRLAIAQLCEKSCAMLDTQSLTLKLKIMKARARQLAPSYQSIEASGIPAEQYLLIQGVREELRLNPEEAIHWYRRARLIINDPTVRSTAPVIADHPDALAVWEYLDRSIDPSIVGRAFSLQV